MDTLDGLLDDLDGLLNGLLNGLLDDLLDDLLNGLSHELIAKFKHAVTPQHKGYIVVFAYYLDIYIEECRKNKAANTANKCMSHTEAYSKFLREHSLPRDITDDLATLLGRVWFSKANSVWGQPLIDPP